MAIEQYAPLIPLFGVAGLAAAAVMYFYLKRQPTGTALMQEIAGLIEEGAMAFLHREYLVLAPVILVVALALTWALGWRIGAAFIFGGVCSIVAGFIGMKSATKCNVRTTEAARTDGQGRALEIAFDGGAVMGLAVASLGLLGLGVILNLYIRAASPGTITAREFIDFAEIMSGFAMGASTIALFARIGGGIYTKAADVGADLVGKVEKGIPEDDPRNPATIADNVGDNVGDVAGMGADIYESYVDAVVAAIAIAATNANFPLTSRLDAIGLPIVLAGGRPGRLHDCDHVTAVAPERLARHGAADGAVVRRGALPLVRLGPGEQAAGRRPDESGHFARSGRSRQEPSPAS